MERTDFEQWKAKEVARLLALVETERRYYQEMVASLPVGLAILAADRYVVSANRAFRQIFGLRTEEMRRKTIDQILGSDALVDRIRDAHLTGTPNPALFLEVDARMYRIAIIPMRNWDDETEIETMLMVEDLSALEALRETKPSAKADPASAATRVAAPVLSGLEDCPAVLWQADPETLAFTQVNGGAEPLLGFPVAHWLDTPNFFSDRIHAEDREATLALYRSAIAVYGDASAEYRAVSASGSVVWCRETVRFTGEPNAKLSGVVLDISNRRRLEAQSLTAARQSALHGLAARLAHDLNNPLMIITGYGEEIRDGMPEADPVRADVDQILNAAGRISGLAGQLLNVTRRQANEPAPLDLAKMLAGLEEKIARAAGSLVSVEVAPIADRVWGMGDAAQLEEVLLAIVSGARDGALGRAHMQVSCGWEPVTERLPGATLKPGVYAAIVVRDDGGGLDPARSASIFESFLASRDAGNPAQSALARGYAIVREWGGDIAFSSEPLHGTIVTLYLPASAAPEPPPAPVEPAPLEQPAAEERVPEPPRKVILVVEDEAGIRALVRKILKREGYDVLEAGSAEEAMNVSAAYDGHIDLLLTDVLLPGLKGRDLAEGMSEALPGLRVLYISGYTSDEAVRTGEFPPGSRFLQKPFTLGALLHSVRECLEA